MDLNILQHYWWILICILGGLLVFLLFVQGGQSLLYTIGKNKDERDLIVNTLKQMGLGCINSWGAWPLQPYLLPYQDYTFQVVITPIRKY